MAQGSCSKTTSEHQCDSALFGETSVSYSAPEVVGVVANEDELEAVVDELLLSGFDRQQISVLAKRRNGGEGSCLAAASSSVTHLEDDPRTHLGAFVSSHSRSELEAAAVGVPIYVFGVGGYAAIVASGGSLALALAALLLAGAAGAGLGGFLAHTIARHHRETIAAQITKGGLLLWVQVRSIAQQNTAMRVLKDHRGRHVHVHDIEREWGIEEVPFHDAQPDPFLECDLRKAR